MLVVYTDNLIGGPFIGKAMADVLRFNTTVTSIDLSSTRCVTVSFSYAGACAALIAASQGPTPIIIVKEKYPVL